MNRATTAVIRSAKDGLDYELLRRPRGSICIQIDGGGAVRVLAPLRTGVGEIEQLLALRRPWIDRKRAEQRARPPGVSTLPSTGAPLPFLGEWLTLELTQGVKTVERVGTILRVPADGSEPALRALKGWYRDQTLRRALHIAPRYTPLIRREPKRFIIREQKTRWGSCSSRGVISLNWRLMLGAPTLFEYVLVHELCHLVHPHHGARFWGEVARFVPDHINRRRMLRHFPGSWFVAP